MPEAPPIEGLGPEAEAAEAPAAAEPEPAPAEGAPTATLGALYLEQGHLDEAAQIFRQLLDRDGGSEVARRGLEEVERRQAGDLTAALLLSGSAAEGEQGPERTSRMLRAYLGRLRSGD